MSNDVGNGVLTAAVIQMEIKSAVTIEDVNFNTDQIIKYMEMSVTGCPGVDIVMFPECCFQGMHPVYWLDVVLGLDSEPIRRVQNKCRELQIWGLFNAFIRRDGQEYIENLAFLVDDDGEIVAKYTKMNPASPVEPTYPGGEMIVCDGPKGARFAIAICSDTVFPEMWREAAFKGANVLLHPSHWMNTVDYLWEVTNRGCAATNTMYVFGVNSVGMDECFSYLGNSMVVDPMGKVICEAPVGIPWVMYAAITPGLADAIKSNNASGFEWCWMSTHPSAGHPQINGKDCRYDVYSVYNQKKSAKENSNE